MSMLILFIYLLIFKIFFGPACQVRRINVALVVVGGGQSSLGKQPLTTGDVRLFGPNWTTAALSG